MKKSSYGKKVFNYLNENKFELSSLLLEEEEEESKEDAEDLFGDSDEESSDDESKEEESSDEESSDDSSEEVWECSYCGKEFDSEKGALFHENRYCRKKRYY